MIVVVNLLPIYQVWAGEWTIVQLALLFWLETMLVILLDWALLKIPLPQFKGQGKAKFLKSGTGFFALPFTLLQAIPLCSVYFFVDIDGVLLSHQESFATTLGNLSIWWVLLFALIANLLSIKRDLVSSGWQRSDAHETLQVQIMGRVMATQFFMIIGMIVAIYLRQPLWILLALVLGKTGFDLLLHWFAHKEKSVLTK